MTKNVFQVAGDNNEINNLKEAYNNTKNKFGSRLNCGLSKR